MVVGEKGAKSLNAAEEATTITKLVSATIAPYRKTTYQEFISKSAEEQQQMKKAFFRAAHEFAKLLNIDLADDEVSVNIGGYQFENGDAIKERSFTFRLNTTPEKARLFAALMGDLGFEQQETVAWNYDADSYEDADGIKYQIPYADKESILKLLDKYDIKNFSYDETRQTLSVLSFDTADVEKFNKLVNDLNKGKNEGERIEIKDCPIKSALDARNNREILYREWYNIDRGFEGEEQTERINRILQEALNKTTSLVAPSSSIGEQQTFTTSFGEVYGFIDPKTLQMYLDEDKITPEHPLHEYTHIWHRNLFINKYYRDNNITIT